jgi:sarcosine oxidase subunit alpha
MGNRLPPQRNEWIDRGRPLNFRFEDRPYSGFAGDTISSALWASGVEVLGRSFKYHRPRGIFSLSGQDSNAVFESELTTNVCGDLTELEDGMDLRAVNTFGSVDRDRGNLVEMFSSFLPVGFYYKAFYTPRRFFPFYEGKMRKMAGLGHVKTVKALKHSPKRYDFCDVLVVGSGPSGISAAITAAEQGLHVVMVEERSKIGGTLSFQWLHDSGAITFVAEQLEKASNLKNLEIRTSTLAAGHYSDNWVALFDAKRLTKLRAKAVVIASGCLEQPAVFRHNDLPGVMLATAAQKLIHNYSVRPLRKALVLTSNAEGYRAALDLLQAGTQVAMIVELRPKAETTEIKSQVERAGIEIKTSSTVYETIPTTGKRGVTGAVVCKLTENGELLAHNTFNVDCDGIVMSVGWAPADGLLRQAGTRMSYSDELEQYVPDFLPAGLYAAGRVNGVYGLDDQIEDGARAGKSAAAYCNGRAGVEVSLGLRHGPTPSHYFPIFPHPHGKNFVDFDEDLQVSDIENAVQEGFDSIELLKRYSTFGMGPSQGKHANLNVARILTSLSGRSLSKTGMTTARPFASAVPLGHLAGRIFSPHRETPLHDRHIQANAKIMYAGNWLRPEYYASAGQHRQQDIISEVLAVRHRVGLIDVSTLGKLEIGGADACELLERMYTGRYEKLPVGMTRYLLMCDESGVMVDDGVGARLASDQFYVTTTSGGSDSVFRELKRWALIWGMDVTLMNVTSHYAAMNLAGPYAREVLQPLTDVNLTQGAFPYLGIREGHVAGVRARLMRVGFVGELGFEIHVPSGSAVSVWDEIMRSGSGHEVAPFGVEAQRVLRLEKGHIIIGQDSDGLTNPIEAGFGWAVKQDKPFFIGQRSLKVLQSKPLARKLIGFEFPVDYRGPLPKECQLVFDKEEIAGWVTSISYSPALGRVVGLGYVKPEQAELGSMITIRTDGGSFANARIVRTPFYDPDNTKQA